MSVTNLATIWYERAQYGNIIKRMIKKQFENFKKEQDRIKKTKLAQNVAYLVQVQSSLIKDEKNVEERITQLEELAGIAKKGVITP